MYDPMTVILRALALHIPILVIFAVGLVIVLTLSSSPLRRPAIAGLTVLFGSHLGHALVMTFLPLLMYGYFDFGHEQYAKIMFLGGMFFSLLEALGYGLLLVALVRALRAVGPSAK